MFLSEKLLYLILKKRLRDALEILRGWGWLVGWFPFSQFDSC